MSSTSPTAARKASCWSSDINLHTQSSFPSETVSIGETAYFAARDPFAGAELWKDDGTEAGTVQVKDINLGDGDPGNPTAVGSTLYFIAGESSEMLWRTDATDGAV